MDGFNDYFSPTNTMASTPFDVLKIDGIEDPLININKLATIDLEESYFAAAVKFINESHKEITDAKLVLYKSISEASTDTVILESFSDFFSKVKDVINKFLKFIKQLFDRFLANLSKLIQNDKFIKKNKETILKFNSDCEFDMTGYEFTFSPGIPIPEAIRDITNDMFADMAVPSSGDLDAEFVRSLNDRLTYDDDWYNRFRGRVLGKDDESIEASDFQEELFRIFRNDSLESDTITVDSSMVTESYRRFTNYNDAKKDTQKEQKEIERAYNKLKDEIKKVSSKNSMNVAALFNYINGNPNNINSIDGKPINKDTIQNTGVAISGELSIAFDIFVKNKVDQVQHCSDIHVLAYGAKLDAMQACFKQDRALLYAAYNMVRKRGIK